MLRCPNDCQPTMETYLRIADLLDVELTELVRTKTKSKRNSYLFELVGNYNTLSGKLGKVSG